MAEQRAKQGDDVIYKGIVRRVIDHNYSTCSCILGEECSQKMIDAVNLKGIGWVREELVSVLPSGEKIK